MLAHHSFLPTSQKIMQRPMEHLPKMRKRPIYGTSSKDEKKWWICLYRGDSIEMERYLDS